MYLLSVKHVIMVKVCVLCSKVMLKTLKLSENSRSWLCMSEASPGGPDSLLKLRRIWIGRLQFDYCLQH